ncbi:MAG: hypothetical protein U9Q81_17705 [Pseudomonadota bacterium]|nr:hypothetical protein [Pseudomonadota bacterium]
MPFLFPHRDRTPHTKKLFNALSTQQYFPRSIRVFTIERLRHLVDGDDCAIGRPVGRRDQDQQLPPPPGEIIVTENDITERPYQALGEIDVTVNKTTIFHPDPTPALVDEKLREKAGEVGADAVVLVRYGTVGVSPMSWGSLNGKGRAVRFVQ